LAALSAHSLKKGVHFKVIQKRTSYHHSGMRQRNHLAMFPEHRCATNGFSVTGATTLGRHLPGKASAQMWEAQFNVVLGRCGNQNVVSRFCSKRNARCSKSWHLTNGLYGRRGQRGVFPETAAAGAAQPHRYASLRV